MNAQKTILVVDDDENLREILKVGLQKEGYHVVTAKNGKEGIKRFDEWHPNLIILDVRMPVMDGYNFYSNMREKLEKTPCPIIGLTGETHIENLFEDFNIDLYVSKPFDIEKLLQKIAVMIVQEKVEKDEGT